MLKRWESAGLRPAEFWSSTPRQIVESFKAREIYFIREQNAQMSMAWHIAVLTNWRSKRKAFPKLKSLLIHEKPARQSMQQQLEIVKMWNAAFGGVVISNRRDH